MFEKPTWDSFYTFKNRRDSALSEICEHLGPEYDEPDSEEEDSTEVTEEVSES